MKKFLIVLALLTIPVSSFAGAAPGTGIVGSPHDMNAYATGGGDATVDAEGRVCAFCHTPHHASTTANAPLWSRAVSVTAYAPYTSNTFDGTVTVLSGSTALCMTCHDGAIAIDAYYDEAVGTTNTTTDVWGDIAVGDTAGLSNDHPVGMNYATVAGTDTGINALPLTYGSGVEVGEVLEGDIMTCATCHDVHNADNNEAYFLYDLQAGSALCITCHDK